VNDVATWIDQHWRHAIEILILALGIYQIFRAFRSTRGARILVALAAILIFFTLISQLFSFEVIGWIITRAAAALALALIVIFQPELRNALAKLGSSRLFLFSNNRKLAFLETFADAVITLSKKRIGALFAIERGISLRQYLDTGVKLDAIFSPELSLAVFYPKAPLHDGGMIIAQDRVAGAACVFPVSPKELGDRSIGLRHRAGIGLSEETDAVIVVVSEETGSISLCIDGELIRTTGGDDFRQRLESAFIINSTFDENAPNEELAR
jgi:diadenylate cyclase